MNEKIVELRHMGYTWNQVDEMILPPEQLKRNSAGKIVSQTFKYAKKAGLDAFTKTVIGAYTATQIVVQIQKFNPFAVSDPW